MIRYLALALLLAGPTYAQPCLGLADAMATMHELDYHKKATGDMTGGHVEVWANDNGDWAVLYVSQDNACVIQEGSNWSEGTGV